MVANRVTMAGKPDVTVEDEQSTVRQAIRGLPEFAQDLRRTAMPTLEYPTTDDIHAIHDAVVSRDIETEPGMKSRRSPTGNSRESCPLAATYRSEARLH